MNRFKDRTKPEVKALNDALDALRVAAHNKRVRGLINEFGATGIGAMIPFDSVTEWLANEEKIQRLNESLIK